MQREITYPLAVVLERRKSKNPWADYVWQVADLLPEMPAQSETPLANGWQEIAVDPEEADLRRFVMWPVSLTLHRRMGEAYDHNMLTEQPAIWVMLDETDDQPVPYKLRGMTADPYEAQGFLDAAEGLIERLPMPVPVRAWMAEYMLEMPEPEQFKKRKRVSFKGEEEQKFGKEPIFTEQGRKLQ